MKDPFLRRPAKPFTAGVINELIERELDKMIFPDGLRETVRAECGRIIIPFLDRTGPLEPGGFLEAFEALLWDNRLYEHRASLIARVWLEVVQALAELNEGPGIAATLHRQMAAIALRYKPKT